MKKILIKERMKQIIAETKYQNQNRAEITVQVLKELICILMAQHHFPPQHWCFDLEIACDAINHTNVK